MMMVEIGLTRMNGAFNSPVIFIPICETFHLEEWKSINLIKTAQKRLFELSSLGQSRKVGKTHLRQLACSVKVELVGNKPHKLLWNEIQLQRVEMVNTCIQVVPHFGGVTTQISPSRTWTAKRWSEKTYFRWLWLMWFILDMFLAKLKHRVWSEFDHCYLHVVYLVDEASGGELVEEEEISRVTEHMPRLPIHISDLPRWGFLLVWTLQGKRCQPKGNVWILEIVTT